MIQFDYERYLIFDSKSKRRVPIRRPVARIRVTGSIGSEEILAWVDTGADLSMLPLSLAEPLGITLQADDQELILGVGREPVLIWHATVNLGLITPGGGPSWAARVGFHSGYQALLGHAGFLDHFTARFNRRAKTLTLTPNGTAPNSV